MASKSTDIDPTAVPTAVPADVAVIGAGGAGLLAGLAAARSGARTVLYERMKTPARKVAISGGGRCNFSNTLAPAEFVRLFGDPNAKRLGHALRAFSRDDLTGLLAAYGVEGSVERGYRLYTKSGRGQDVVRALCEEFRKAGGILETEAHIRSLARDAESGFYALGGRFRDGSGERQARTVVVCTGGLSYPVTGSTGDGYPWARAFGHGVTALRPALVGLTVEEGWPRKLQGLAWPDASVSLWRLEAPTVGKERPLCAERAEILFTHFGVSGPAILDVSNAFVRSGLARAGLRIDFLPDLDRKTLDGQIVDRFTANPGREMAAALKGLLPARLLSHFQEELNLTGVPAGRIPREARQALADKIKRTTLTLKGTRGMEFGEVTAGGVEWAELDPATMESRCAPGLFFAGEILDLTGRCGGFNLQAAFSTGYLAGLGAARRAKEER